MPDPSMAYEVSPSIDAAVRHGARGGSIVVEGEDTVVWRFEVGTDADKLRRAMEEGVAVRVGFRNGSESGLWGVGGVDEAGGSVTLLVPVARSTSNERQVRLDEIAWIEVHDDVALA